ncbi:MAG: sugar ABC transporter permease [Streptosporangiaceae bacterium]|jgi:multiple sugar transport system permease protein
MSDTATLKVPGHTPPPQAMRRRGVGRSSWSRRRDRRGLAFIAPFMLAFGLFTLVPLGYAIYDSVFTTRIIGGTTFTGFGNYSQVLTSGPFWGGFGRVIIFGAIQIPVMLVVAFFFATVFDLGVTRLGRTFRTIFFIPFAVPIVVAAIMWGFLLEPTYGPITHLANVLGFGGTNFLSSGLMLPSIIVIAIWEWTGYNSIILYSALKSVPRDVVEAAILDDTPLWKIILKVKLPMVRSAIVMLIFLNSIGALQLFIEPEILSYQGGSITNTWTPVVDIYNTSIANAQYNLGAAMAVVLALAIIAVSVGSMAFRRHRGELA